jgi:hypothetical protein
MNGLFKQEPVLIDKTPILITQIRSIGQLITYTSFDEVVADSVIITKSAALVRSFNHFAPFPVLPSAEKQLVLIGRGKIMAGIDLSLVTGSGVTARNDTVTIVLPKAQILDAILNPSDFETFVEKGEWSEQEVTRVKAKARRKMLERALNQNLLQKADARAKVIMENFLHNIGFSQVVITQ